MADRLVISFAPKVRFSYLRTNLTKSIAKIAPPAILMLMSVFFKIDSNKGVDTKIFWDFYLGGNAQIQRIRVF